MDFLWRKAFFYANLMQPKKSQAQSKWYTDYKCTNKIYICFLARALPTLNNLQIFVILKLKAHKEISHLKCLQSNCMGEWKIINF